MRHELRGSFSHWRRGLPIFALLITLTAYVLTFDNFHTILAQHQIFGSAQMSGTQLEQAIQEHEIRTIINLRGDLPTAWYQEECQVARRHEVEHHDFNFCSVMLPPRQDMIRLLHVLQSAPRPLLIHCQSGIDRTGLAAITCILLLDENGSPAKARAHLSPWRGHLRWRKTVMLKERFLHRYETWLAMEELTHHPRHFSRWIHEDYEGAPFP